LGSGDLLVGPAAGSNTVVLGVVPSIALWSATANASWLHLPFSSGTGSANVLFTYDANPGATRSGTLTIGGQTLVVSQAGAPYVAAPGPVTPLATGANGLVDPVDLALDSSGNVYFADSGNDTIKEWNRASNTVTSLVTNLTDTPQGIAVDSAGNVYFAVFETGAVEEWVASSHTVITVVSNLTDPAGIALDAAGNIYIADAGFGIYEWTAANSTLTPLVTSGLASAYGVAVDAAGNVYIADTYGNNIQEWFVANHTVTTLVSNQLSFPWDLTVDGCGNVYIADGSDGAIKEWVAANHALISPIPIGLSTPTDVAVDASQNLYVADYGNSAIKELPHAYVNPTPVTEQKAAGSDVLPVVLFTTEDLLPPFAPTVNQPWLGIGGIVNDAVTFNFTSNSVPASRTGNITVLGQNIPVTQLGVVVPPLITNAKMVTNGVFQFNFNETNPNATFTVISTTNVTIPLTNWTVIGAASNISPGVLQFTDLHATNQTRYYMVRSP
jgi:streptogramin lyase